MTETIALQGTVKQPVNEAYSRSLDKLAAGSLRALFDAPSRRELASLTGWPHLSAL